MIPYLILIFVPLLFSVVASTAVLKEYHGKWSLSVGIDRNIQKNSLLIPVFFIIFFIVLALRDESIGVDVKQYRILFDSIAHMELDEVFQKEGDLLYNLLNWIVSRFTENYRIFLIIVAGIILMPIAKLYGEDREFGFLKIIMFMVLPVFIMIFSGFRQAIAFSVGTIVYKYVREKKIFKVLIFSFIALGFHHSAFIIFLFYPLYHINLKRRQLWLVIPVIALVFAFNKPIFLWLTELATTLFYEDYNTEITETNAYSMLILFILLAIFSYAVLDEKHADQETLGLRNFLLFSVLLQCFVPLHSLAMRMNYYYLLFIPILIPKVIKNSKYYFNEVGYLANGVLSLFFLIYYLIKTYVSCSTGISSLGTYPYIPFWQ